MSDAGNPTCKVDGCGASLVHEKTLHIRCRVCEKHTKAQTVKFSGQLMRFCQQCSRLDPLEEFDGTRRSCRKSLLRVVERRRTQRAVSHNNSNGISTRGTASQVNCTSTDDQVQPTPGDTPSACQNKDDFSAEEHPSLHNTGQKRKSLKDRLSRKAPKVSTSVFEKQSSKSVISKKTNPVDCARGVNQHGDTARGEPSYCDTIDRCRFRTKAVLAGYVGGNEQRKWAIDICKDQQSRPTLGKGGVGIGDFCSGRRIPSATNMEFRSKGVMVSAGSSGSIEQRRCDGHPNAAVDWMGRLLVSNPYGGGILPISVRLQQCQERPDVSHDACRFLPLHAASPGSFDHLWMCQTLTTGFLSRKANAELDKPIRQVPRGPPPKGSWPSKGSIETMDPRLRDGPSRLDHREALDPPPPWHFGSARLPSVSPLGNVAGNRDSATQHAAASAAAAAAAAGDVPSHSHKLLDGAAFMAVNPYGGETRKVVLSFRHDSGPRTPEDRCPPWTEKTPDVPSTSGTSGTVSAAGSDRPEATRECDSACRRSPVAPLRRHINHARQRYRNTRSHEPDSQGRGEESARDKYPGVSSSRSRSP